MTEPLRFRPNRKLLYVRYAGALILAVFPTVALMIAMFNLNARFTVLLLWMLIVYAAFVALRILYVRAHFETIVYELTERDLTNAAGLFWKMRRSTPLEKVTNVDIRQGPLERRWGIGNIWVFTPSTGALTPEAMLIGIDQPHEIRARILELAEKARPAPAIAAPAAGEASADAGRLGNEPVLAEILRTLQRIETLLRNQAAK